MTITSLVNTQLPPLREEEAKALAESSDQLQKQATLTIGMIGHVAHGKSSFVRAVSGIVTSKHSHEQLRNSTIQLGYANFKIFKCENLFCNPPDCYQSHSSKTTKTKCAVCDSNMELVRHASFVDCPGHEMLMRTMLSGAAAMDAAILVVAGNERVPQPQTLEHLVAAEIVKLNIITVQNKVDLITPPQAFENKGEIVRMLKGTSAERGPIIPVCCAPKRTANIDVLLQYIMTKVPEPQRDLLSPPRMNIIRSFDVNPPGTSSDKLKGGVCGGSLSQGILRVGEIIEIRPGAVFTEPDGTTTYSPYTTRVTALLSEQNSLKAALPGGLIGVGTKLDPTLTKKNRMVGCVVGRLGTLPDVYIKLNMEYNLIARVVGDAAEQKVSKLEEGQELLLIVGSATVRATVQLAQGRSSGAVRVALAQPVCTVLGAGVSVSRKVNGRFRLIGRATVTKGVLATLKILPGSEQPQQQQQQQQQSQSQQQESADMLNIKVFVGRD